MDLTKTQEKEVEKRLRQRIYEKTRNSAGRFKLEFKKQIVVAISAALGFLIALSWREPLSEFVNLIVGSLGFGGQVFWKFVSALAVTFLAVIGLFLLAKWKK